MSGAKLKTDSETGERPYERVRLARFVWVRLLPYSYATLNRFCEKKSTVLQSSFYEVVLESG